MEFENKKWCVFSIWKYHIKHSLDYSVYKYDTKRYIIKSVNQECKLKCRASLGKGGGWVVSKISGAHTYTSYPMSQDHRKLDSDIISHNIKNIVNSDASLKVKHIIAHICDKYNYTISYKNHGLQRTNQSHISIEIGRPYIMNYHNGCWSWKYFYLVL